jgi:hypothetical protein
MIIDVGSWKGFVINIEVNGLGASSNVKYNQNIPNIFKP